MKYLEHELRNQSMSTVIFGDCESLETTSFINSIVAAAVNHSHVVLPDNVFSNAFSVQRALGFKDVSWYARDCTPLSALKTASNIPLVTSSVSKDSKYKSPMSRKTFLALKDAGRIVLKPYLASSTTIHDRVLVSPESLISQESFIAGSQTPLSGGTWFSCDRYGNALRASEMKGLPEGRWRLGEAIGYSESSNPGVSKLYETSGKTVFQEYGTPDIEALELHLMGLPLDNNLYISALSDLNSATFDLLTEIGEAPETVKYLFDILRRLILLFIGAKSKEVLLRKRFKGKELISELASLWMQFRYAASPLAYSLSDGLKYLDMQFREYVTVRKRLDSSFQMDLGGYTYKGTFETRCFAKGRVDALAKYHGLGLDPVKTLWELTPLSFIVDWIIPIGNWLAALRPPSSMMEQGVLTSWRVRNMEVTIDGLSLDNSIDYYRATLPKSGPSLPTPDIFLDWKRVMDSLALAWNFFLKQHWKS